MKGGGTVGSGGMPPVILWYFHALRQLLVQSETKTCSVAVASTVLDMPYTYSYSFQVGPNECLDAGGGGGGVVCMLCDGLRGGTPFFVGSHGLLSFYMTQDLPLPQYRSSSFSVAMHVQCKLHSQGLC